MRKEENQQVLASNNNDNNNQHCWTTLLSWAGVGFSCTPVWKPGFTTWIWYLLNPAEHIIQVTYYVKYKIYQSIFIWLHLLTQLQLHIYYIRLGIFLRLSELQSIFIGHNNQDKPGIEPHSGDPLMQMWDTLRRSETNTLNDCKQIHCHISNKYINM